MAPKHGKNPRRPASARTIGGERRPALRPSLPARSSARAGRGSGSAGSPTPGRWGSCREGHRPGPRHGTPLMEPRPARTAASVLSSGSSCSATTTSPLAGRGDATNQPILENAPRRRQQPPELGVAQLGRRYHRSPGQVPFGSGRCSPHTSHFPPASSHATIRCRRRPDIADRLSLRRLARWASTFSRRSRKTTSAANRSCGSGGEIPSSAAIDAIPPNCFSVAPRACARCCCCCCTSRTDLKTLVTPTCGVSGTPTCGVSGLSVTPTCGVSRPAPPGPVTPTCGVSGARSVASNTPGSGVSVDTESVPVTPACGVPVCPCGVRKIRIVLWYFLRSTCTNPVSRSSASVRDTTLIPVSSSPASVRCLIPISSTSSPRVHARPKVHSARYHSFNRFDPTRTRRARRMNVSGCSGGEASDPGSRGCGLTYASAGAPSLSTDGLVLDPDVGVNCFMRWASSAPTRPPTFDTRCCEHRVFVCTRTFSVPRIPRGRLSDPVSPILGHRPAQPPRVPLSRTPAWGYRSGCLRRSQATS